MLSRCQTEYGKQEERGQREESPQPAHERTLRLPELLREQHHDDQEARVTAEDEVAAVERVTQHRPLVDEDVLDGCGSVAGHSRTTMGSGSRKKCPPAHESLSVK